MLRGVPLILLIPLDRGYPDPVDTPAPDFGHRESMPLLFNGNAHLGYAPQTVDHQSSNRVVGTGGQLDAGPLNELVETEQPVDQVGAVSGLGRLTIAAPPVGNPAKKSHRGGVAGLSSACPRSRSPQRSRNRALRGRRMNKSEELT